MKQNIKHISPYVPFGLNTLYKLSDVISLREGVKDETRSKELTQANLDFVCQFCIPILRRCEDLLLPKWKDLDVLSSTENQTELYNIANTSDRKWVLSYTSYGFVQFLLENHFDVFDLIPKGLAMDINTLSVQNDG